MERVRVLFKASRPVMWFIPLLAFLIAFRVSGAGMTWLAAAQLAMMSLPYNLFLYGINDVYDYESDRLNPRKGGAQGLKLGPELRSIVMKASLASAALLALSSLLTYSLLNMLGTAVLLSFSYAYSATPLRLKTRPPLDSFSNGMIYCLGPALMGFSYGGTLSDITYKMYYVALCVMGSHAISTIFDYDYDMRAGDTTFAVRFGRRAAAAFGIATYAVTYSFAGIQSAYLRYFLLLCMAVASYIFIVDPKRKVTFALVRMLTLAFIIAALVYLGTYQ